MENAGSGILGMLMSTWLSGISPENSGRRETGGARWRRRSRGQTRTALRLVGAGRGAGLLGEAGLGGAGRGGLGGGDHQDRLATVVVPVLREAADRDQSGRVDDQGRVVEVADVDREDLLALDHVDLVAHLAVAAPRIALVRGELQVEDRLDRRDRRRDDAHDLAVHHLDHEHVTADVLRHLERALVVVLDHEHLVIADELQEVQRVEHRHNLAAAHRLQITRLAQHGITSELLFPRPSLGLNAGAI